MPMGVHMIHSTGPRACSVDECNAAAAISAGLDACRKLLLSKAMDDRERHAIRVRIVEAEEYDLVGERL